MTPDQEFSLRSMSIVFCAVGLMGGFTSLLVTDSAIMKVINVLSISVLFGVIGWNVYQMTLLVGAS